MTPPYQIKKVSDEGTSCPFISRLFMGMFEFRDQLFLMGTEGQQREIMKAHFDQQFKPMFEAAQATRDSARKARELLVYHLIAVQSGKVIKFRDNQLDILETIDIPLSQTVDQLIDQSIIATKTGLQNILKDPLDLDIGFFFMSDGKFGQGIADLRASGENNLSQYLMDVRNSWHLKLQDLRAQHEHKGWSLDNIEYRLTETSMVRPILPKILGMPVNEFTLKTANRVLLFIENMMIYAVQRYCQQYPIFVVEIPIESRGQENPKRFKLAPKGLDTSPPWVVAYHDDMDFV
jgi:hypothetical protein